LHRRLGLVDDFTVSGPFELKRRHLQTVALTERAETATIPDGSARMLALLASTGVLFEVVENPVFSVSDLAADTSDKVGSKADRSPLGRCARGD